MVGDVGIVYLDNNATTRTAPEVVRAMHEYWSDLFLNPSSVAGGLLGADKPLRDAQRSLSKLLGCADSGRFVLTSGATEANNWALFSMFVNPGPEDCLIVSSIEHPSVLEPALELGRRGVKVSQLPVTELGVIDLGALQKVLTPQTKMVSVMLANNETGVIQPVSKIARIIRSVSPTCIIHSDVTQAVGKISVNLDEELCDIDLISLSAHKFNGPKGIGALFIRDGVVLSPLLYGGGQQSALRPGTENPALAAGMAMAAKLAILTYSKETQKKIEALRDYYEEALLGLFPDSIIIGMGVARLPNTSLVILPNIDIDEALYVLSEKKIIVSSGSACSAGSISPPKVLSAMGIDDVSFSGHSLRVSLSAESTKKDIEKLLATLAHF